MTAPCDCGAQSCGPTSPRTGENGPKQQHHKAVVRFAPWFSASAGLMLARPGCSAPWGRWSACLLVIVRAGGPQLICGQFGNTLRCFKRNGDHTPCSPHTCKISLSAAGATTSRCGTWLRAPRGTTLRVRLRTARRACGPQSARGRCACWQVRSHAPRAVSISACVKIRTIIHYVSPAISSAT